MQLTIRPSLYFENRFAVGNVAEILCFVRIMHYRRESRVRRLAVRMAEAVRPSSRAISPCCVRS